MIEIDASIIDSEELLRRIKAKVILHKKQQVSEIIEGDNAAAIIFPYHLFRKGARLFLVGSHELVQCFLKQASEDGYVDVCGIWEASWDGEQMEMEGREAPFVCCYDAVLIAVIDRERACRIKERLLELGINEKFIKWDGASYTLGGFKRRVYLPLLSHLGME